MTGWWFGNMAWASLVMLLVLAIRRPTAAWLGAGPAYALWALPALRLVMPPLPTFGADIPSLLPPLAVTLRLEEAAAPLPPDGGPGQWVPWLLALWAGGAAVFLIWQFLAYRAFLTRLSLGVRSIGAHRGLPLVESDAVDGPLALGLLDRRIVVPRDFATRYAPAEQSLALDHEAIHHRRGDIWWNHVALAMLALHWFNPIAWLSFRAFRADQELACDAAIAAGATPERRQDYARALVKSASRPGLIAACPLNHADQLKRRLKMMKDHEKSRLRLLVGTAAILGLAGASAMLGTPGVAEPSGEGVRKEIRERTVIIEKAEHGDRNVQRSERRLEGDEAEELAGGCPAGGTTVADINDGPDNRRTRMVVCLRGDATPAQRLEALQSARNRLGQDSEMNGEQRQRIAERLDQEIARLRGN